MIFGINTTSDISKLSQITYNNFEISLVYLCQISLQIMLLPILSFLLLLNSLIFLSFFGFLRNAGTWIATCVYFFSREYHDFLICFHACQCRRDCRIRGSASTAIGRRWKTVGKFTNTYSGHEWIFPKNFFSGRRLSSSNSSFIVYCKRSSALPTFLCWHVFAQPARTLKIWTNREARKKPIRNPLISNAQICPCDSAGYQNELLGTNSQTDYNNGLRDTWAGCKAG